MPYEFTIIDANIHAVFVYVLAAKTVDPSAFPVQIVLCAYFKPTLSVEQIRAAIEYLQVLISDMTTKYGNCPVVFGSDRNKVNIVISEQLKFMLNCSNPDKNVDNLNIT